MNRAIVIGALALLVADPAFAKPSTTVFPLSAPNLPIKIASAPEELSKALAEALDGTVAQITIVDAAGTLGCDAEASTCLESVSKAFKSKRIVFGEIKMLDGGRLKVTLTRFDPGPDRQQRTFTLEGSVPEMSEELVKLSRPLFDGELEVQTDDPPTEGPTDLPGTGGPVEKPPTGSGSISGTTWGVFGVSVAAVAVGGAFLWSANSIANEIENADKRTEEDFEKLRVLEDRGAQRQMIGTIVAAAGAALFVYGVVRYFQDRSQPAPRDAVGRFTPVPIEGGAALVFTLELP